MSTFYATNRQLPTIENVRGLDSSRNGFNTASNIACVGIVGYIVLSLFHCVIDDHRYLGNGRHENVFGNVITTLPTCRNDRESAFVSRRYCRVVELPDEASQQILARMGGR